MATRPVSVRRDAYERLRAARTITGGELLARLREHGPRFTLEALDRIEPAKEADRPPEDKWWTG